MVYMPQAIMRPQNSWPRALWLYLNAHNFDWKVFVAFYRRAGLVATLVYLPFTVLNDLGAPGVGFVDDPPWILAAYLVYRGVKRYR